MYIKNKIYPRLVPLDRSFNGRIKLQSYSLHIIETGKSSIYYIAYSRRCLYSCTTLFYLVKDIFMASPPSSCPFVSIPLESNL